MKLLYLVHQFYPEYYTGTEKFVLNMAKMMQIKGHKTKVCTYSFQKDLCHSVGQRNIIVREYSYQGIPVEAFTHKNPPVDLHYGLTNKDVAGVAEKFLRKEHVDIIHVGHPMRVTEIIHAARKINVPYCITLTDFWLICPKYNLLTTDGNLCNGPEGGKTCAISCPEFPNEIIAKRLEMAKNIMECAVGVFSPSQFLADIFMRQLPGIEIEVINHGMSYNKVRKNKRIYNENDKLTFFYGGSFNHFKGVHVLIEAFRQISSPNINLMLYGSGPDQKYTKLLNEIANGDKRIEFCGVYSDNEIGEILSQVDVAIVPSLWYENYPLVLHEALACDVPVIASDIGGMAEKIKDGHNGFTFQVGNVDSLREVIHRIVSDPSILNGLKDNIRNFMIPTLEQESYAYESIYKILGLLN